MADLEEIDAGEESRPSSKSSPKSAFDASPRPQVVPEKPSVKSSPAPKRKPDACNFSEFGCQFHGSESTVEKHIDAEPVKHLTLLCDVVRPMIGDCGVLQTEWEALSRRFERIYPRHDQLMKRWGSHLIWKIDNYEERLEAAKTGTKSVLFSPPFVSARHGYKMIASCALYGDGTARGKFMSVFVSILKGDNDSLLVWPFCHKITFSLLNQSANLEQGRDITYVVKPNTIKENNVFLGRPQHERNPSFGAQKFAELAIFSEFEYVKDDALYLKVVVDGADADVL